MAARRFVLTGGHGVGKSSLLKALELLGEHVVPEAAQDVRLLLQAAGEPFPTDRDDFEERCLRLHQLREERSRTFNGRVFLDRGAPDHLAYAEVGPWSLSAADRDFCLASRYDGVFLVLPHGDEWGGTLRVGEREFCDRLVAELRRVYTALGHVVLDVPPATVWERAEWVLTHTAEPGQQPASRSVTSAQKAGM